MELGLILLPLLVLGVVLLVGLVAAVFWLLDKLVGRRGDRALRGLNRRLARGEITPDEYRAEVSRIEGGDPAPRA